MQGINLEIGCSPEANEALRSAGAALSDLIEDQSHECCSPA
jgi:hypothetical protein